MGNDQISENVQSSTFNAQVRIRKSIRRITLCLRETLCSDSAAQSVRDFVFLRAFEEFRGPSFDRRILNRITLRNANFQRAIRAPDFERSEQRWWFEPRLYREVF